MELDLIDSEMLLFRYVCTPISHYIIPAGGWGHSSKLGDRGDKGPLEEIFGMFCWPIVYAPMVLGDPWYFPMVIPI